MTNVIEITLPQLLKREAENLEKTIEDGEAYLGKMADIIPELLSLRVQLESGRKGNWTLKTFTVNEKQSELTFNKALVTYGNRGFVPRGTYTILTHKKDTVMSDSPDEISDHLPFFDAAKGHVLVGGLGIGLCIQSLQDKRGVESLTILEKSKDVIDLVGRQYQERIGNWLKIVHCDVFDFVPERHYDAIWMDIWTPIGSENIPEMDALRAKYQPCCDWFDCWLEERCRDMKRIEKQHETIVIRE